MQQARAAMLFDKNRCPNAGAGSASAWVQATFLNARLVFFPSRYTASLHTVLTRIRSAPMTAPTCPKPQKRTHTSIFGTKSHHRDGLLTRQTLAPMLGTTVARPHAPSLARHALQRLPIAALRPYVALLWCSLPSLPSTADAAVAHETMLPSGAMHLVFRLGDAPLWIAEVHANQPTRLQGGFVGGARSRFYVRASATLASSVGAVFQPGAARALLGAPASHLAGRHTALPALWGGAAGDLHAQLELASSAAERIELLEAALLARLTRVRMAQGLHPGIGAALGVLPNVNRVRDAVQASGMSHRHFILRFREALGLDPKAYLRVLRFQRALQAMARGLPLVEVALESGYCDQAHMAREFSAMAGIAPSACGYQLQVRNIQDAADAAH